MKRRDFLQFMGVSAAASSASVALAKIPEAEKQIILLNKPKDIIIANKMPGVDFIIKSLIEISIIRNDNIIHHAGIGDDVSFSKRSGIGTNDITIKLQTYNDSKFEPEHVLSIPEDRPGTFSFDLENFDERHEFLYELNNKKFVCSQYKYHSSYNAIDTVTIIGHQIHV